jgi:hypothetical protein
LLGVLTFPIFLFKGSFFSAFWKLNFIWRLNVWRLGFVAGQRGFAAGRCLPFEPLLWEGLYAPTWFGPKAGPQTVAA